MTLNHRVGGSSPPGRTLTNFLRKYMGWASADLAHRIGVTPESVSRWENGHEPIGAVPDRTLRLMVALENPVENYHAE